MTIKTPSKKLLSVCIILFLVIATLFGGFALLYSGVRIENIKIAKVSISGLYLRLHNKFILEVQEIDLSNINNDKTKKNDFDTSNITDYVKYATWGIAYFEHLDIKRIVLNKEYVASVSYNGEVYSLSFPRLQAVFDVSTKDNNMLLDIKYLTMSKPDFSIGGRIIYSPKGKKVGFGLVVLPMNMEDLKDLNTTKIAQFNNQNQNPQNQTTSNNSTQNAPTNEINTNNQAKLFLQGSSDFKTLKLQAKTTKIKNLDFLAEILGGSEILPSLNLWLFNALDFESIEVVDSHLDISLNPKQFVKSILQNTTAQAKVQKVAYYLPATLSPATLLSPSNGKKAESKKERFPTPFIAKTMQLTMKEGSLILSPESFSYDVLSLAGTNLIFSFGKNSFSEKPMLHIDLHSPKVSLSQGVHNLLKYFSISLPIDNVKGDIKAQVGISIDLSKKKNTQNLDSKKDAKDATQEITQNNKTDSLDFAMANPSQAIAQQAITQNKKNATNNDLPKSTPQTQSSIIVQGTISAKDATLQASSIDLLTKSALVQININPNATDSKKENNIIIETKNTSYENLFDIDTKTTINLDEKRLKTSLFVHSLRVSTNPQVNERILNPKNIQKREDFLKELNKKSSHKERIKPVYYASLSGTKNIKSDLQNDSLANISLENILLARLDSSQETESSDFVMPKPMQNLNIPSTTSPSINTPNTNMPSPKSSAPTSPSATPPSIELPTPPKQQPKKDKKPNAIIEKTGDMLLPKTANEPRKNNTNSAEQIAKLHPNDNDDGDDGNDSTIDMPKSSPKNLPTKDSKNTQNPKKEIKNIESKNTQSKKAKSKDSNAKISQHRSTNQATNTPKHSGKIITKGVELDFSKPMSEATMRAKIIELIKAQNETVFTYDIFRADKQILPQIDIDMDFSSDEISINIPSLQTYAKMLNSQIVIAVRDFAFFAPYSPLMKYLGLHSGSAILHLRSAKDIAFEVQIKDFPTFLLKKDKTPFKDFVFQGQYKDDKLRIKSAPQGLISFESYDNTMLVRFKNVDIDINALLSSKIPALEEAFSISDEKSAVFSKEQILAENEFLRQKRRYERQNNIKPHIIAIEAQNIVGFYKQITLPFDDFNAKIRDDRITADATYGNGIANIDIIHGNTLFKAGNFSADFLNKVIGRKIAEGGLFEAGGIYKNNIFNGEISMQNTSFKGFAIVQNIIGLIDTIPSLVMFRSPGLSSKGYEVKNGKIILGLNAEYIALESIDLIGKTMDIKGNGIIEIDSSEVDIGLSISTLKSLTSVLNKIPIVGYLILGKDGKITTQVSVDGTLENPKSQVSLAQDILTAPLNIIKRAFTPVDMLIDEVVKSID
ncbi:YhdP family protein [Helicobacter sp. T3_23-1059]